MSAKQIISVAVITYNQENTIAQTLDSILMQKGDFKLQIVVGEDCSKDNTYIICKQYADKYPDTIILLPNTHNLGIMANFARVMNACTGDFVGICAGDDYWCDEHKLQKQLDFFNSHADCGVVSTSGYALLVKQNQLVPNAVAPCHPITDGNIKPFYFSSTYKGGVYAMPLSLLIRKEALQYVDFDDFVRCNLPVEDYPMQAILSQHTRWGHIDDLTVVYRVYSGSASFVSLDNPKYLEYHKGLMRTRRYLNEKFPNDICFTEEWIKDYLFYKEFLLYLHKKDYKQARALLQAAPEEIRAMPHFKQTKKVCRTYISFIFFHYYKEYKYKTDIQSRT